MELARASGDDRAMVEALHARKEALPGPAGRAERLALAAEMLALAPRTGSARTAMWGELWRIDALVEDGRLVAAAEELPSLQVAVERVGGPGSWWHLERTSAYVAQARGRYEEALAEGRRAYERMRPIEARPATGAYFPCTAPSASTSASATRRRRSRRRPSSRCPGSRRSPG